MPKWVRQYKRVVGVNMEGKLSKTRKGISQNAFVKARAASAAAAAEAVKGMTAGLCTFGN